MATVDLVNEIAPKHPRRPVKTSLASLRAMIKSASGSLYSDEYLDRCNYNDLVGIIRQHSNTSLPIEYIAP